MDTTHADPAAQKRRLVPNHVVLWRGERRRLVFFGPFAGLAVATGLALLAGRLAAGGVDPLRALPVIAAVVVPGVVVGSRLWALLVELRVRPLREAILRTGFAFQGGLAGVGVGLLLAAWWLDLPPLLLCDAAAISLPAAHAIGRVGCLTYGCCYGRPTNVPWAMRYTCPEAKAVWEGGLGHTHIHPTPLYQAIGSLSLGILLAWLTRWPLPLGAVAGGYLFVAAIGRWVLEHWRQSAVRPTPFQRFALVQGAVGLAVLALAATQPDAPWTGRPAFPSLALLSSGLGVWMAVVAVGVAVPLGLQGRRPGVF